ncbi:hypothetical protein J6590_071683 [Homalodisca vitripennis]|nr:hypothetical protein J6590_071683 [Homalodisca vitripennis]
MILPTGLPHQPSQGAGISHVIPTVRPAVDRAREVKHDEPRRPPHFHWTKADVTRVGENRITMCVINLPLVPQHYTFNCGYFTAFPSLKRVAQRRKYRGLFDHDRNASSHCSVSIFPLVPYLQQLKQSGKVGTLGRSIPTASSSARSLSAYISATGTYTRVALLYSTTRTASIFTSYKRNESKYH